MVRKRRHHNNDGRRTIFNGTTRRQIRRIARILKIPYGGNINANQISEKSAEKKEK
jgi:hypothetical protein